MSKIVIHYDPFDGYVVPDGRTEKLIDDLVEKYNSGQDMEVVFGNELPIYYIRLAVLKGKLDCNDVVFQYNDSLISIHKDGRLPR